MKRLFLWERLGFRKRRTSPAAIAPPAVIDPVCLVHGKRRSEHECLYCCLCFKPLTGEECSYLPDGTQHNVCVPCAEAEYAALVRIAQERN